MCQIWKMSRKDVVWQTPCEEGPDAWKMAAVYLIFPGLKEQHAVSFTLSFTLLLLMSAQSVSVVTDISNLNFFSFLFHYTNLLSVIIWHSQEETQNFVVRCIFSLWAHYCWEGQKLVVLPCKDCILKTTKTNSIQHPLLSDLEKCKLDHNRSERLKRSQYSPLLDRQ